MPDLRRPLTAGEIAMARSVFRDGIDYARVRVVCGSFLPFNLQDQNTAMTPRGSLYFMPAQYRIDFSREDAGGKLFFIHEMVHVWQWQLGYNCIWHGLLLALFGGYFRQRAYRYDSSVAGTAFAGYNMEQQAELVSHYFGATQLGLASMTARLPFLREVLGGFLQSPGNASLLPRRWFTR